MENAKEELIEKLADWGLEPTDILAAVIDYEPYSGYVKKKERKSAKLPVGYTTEQLQEFINALDFEYNSGFGTQELFGTLWLKNGCWAERGEYDGSEWWSLKERPAIPRSLRGS
jgi:hypothetical protein